MRFYTTIAVSLLAGFAAAHYGHIPKSFAPSGRSQKSSEDRLYGRDYDMSSDYSLEALYPREMDDVMELDFGGHYSEEPRLQRRMRGPPQPCHLCGKTNVALHHIDSEIKGRGPMTLCDSCAEAVEQHSIHHDNKMGHAFDMLKQGADVKGQTDQGRGSRTRRY